MPKKPQAPRSCISACLTAAFTLTAAGAAVAGGASFEATADVSPRLAASPLTDRLIIKYRSGSAGATRSSSQSMSAAHEAAGRAGVQMRVLRSTAVGAHVMKTDRSMTAQEAAALARSIKDADPNIEYAEPDRRMYPQWAPTDPDYWQQWHYYEPTGGINLPGAWDRTTGAGVRVAVIDTGYRPHADLLPNIVGGFDFITDGWSANDGGGRDNDASDPGDFHWAQECNERDFRFHNSGWHGTHVAGTVAAVANNGRGGSGVAPGAKVVPLRVLGKCGGWNSDIADAIAWAAGVPINGMPANPNPARVANLSLGGPGDCGFMTQDAINAARNRGMVVVVAAGNNNQDARGFSPANCAGVITVGATNRWGARAGYSNFGPAVDVSAPGGETWQGFNNGVYSTLNNGATAPGWDSYAFYEGTSMAAPHVAGVAALMLARNPALNPDNVESILKRTARALPVPCNQCGAGIINAAAAVEAAVGGGGGGGGGNGIAEREWNDSLNSAQALTVNPATVAGTIGHAGDTDYYMMTLPNGGTLSATLQPNGASDYDLIMYDRQGREIGRSEQSVGAVDSISRTNTTGAPQTWFVQVVYYSGNVGSSGSYTLTLRQ